MNISRALTIRKSKEEDIPNLVQIYNHAIYFLKSQNVDQWQDGAPNATTAKNDIDEGISYVVSQEDEIIATAALVVGEDETYFEMDEGEWLTDNKNYGVIHRIAVSQNSKSRGVAGFIIDYCKKITSEQGFTSVRCDTHKDNKIMQRTLLSNGFVYCGIITIGDGTKRLAYELII